MDLPTVNKLLGDVFQDAFGELPTIRDSIHTFLRNQLDKLGSKEFVYSMLEWFGGRSYNCFLDYSLLSVKLGKFFWNNIDHDIYWSNEEDIHEMLNYLLHCDRHDMYQNVPYYLEDIEKKSCMHKKFPSNFHTSIAEMLIECFNPNGTEDNIYTFSYETMRLK